MENAEIWCVVRPRHRQQIRARSADGDTFVDHKLGSGQCYGLAFKRGIEINRVTVIGVGERLTQ